MNVIDEEKFIVYKFSLTEKDENLKELIQKYLNFENINQNRNFKIQNPEAQIDILLRKKAKFEDKLKNFLNLVDAKKTTYDVQLENDEVILFVKKG